MTTAVTEDPYAWQRPHHKTALPMTKCPYCGLLPHDGACPRVKAFEYYEDGSLKRVEFKTASEQ